MLIFDGGFMHLRQEYILPLSQYSVQNRSINSNGIKKIIGEHKYTGFNLSGKKYIFEFDENILLKAQLADAWKAYIRAILQRDAARQNYTLQPDYCPNWSIVTDYYFAFFCACTVLRLTMRGNMYIDPKTAKGITDFITDIYGSSIKFPDGNIDYYIEKSSTYGKYNLIIQKNDRSTHEAVWIQMEKLLDEMYQNSMSKTEEKMVLGSFKAVFNCLGAYFPSSLRNEVNYQLQYGVEAVTKAVLPSNACKRKTTNWLTGLLSYDLKLKTLPIREARFCEYTEYLYRLMINLEHEYRNLEAKNVSLFAFINDKRTDKITEPQYTYTDL